MSPHLLSAKQRVLEIAKMVGTVQEEAGLPQPTAEFIDELRFGMMEVTLTLIALWHLAPNFRSHRTRLLATKSWTFFSF